MQSLQNNKIHIALSKTKITLLIVGSFVFVAASVWIWYEIGNVLIALAGITFFGMCGIYGIIKLFDMKPGLIIGEKGVLDNASAVSGGLIQWNDITGIEHMDINNSRFILIFVSNPESYLARVNRFKRLWMSMNNSFCGTPLTIPANTLKYDYCELLAILKQYWQKQEAN